MRLIDADKLKAHYAWLDYGTTLTKADVDAIVDEQPNVEAEPVVRGEWINPYADDERIGDFVKHCSVCCNAIIKSLSASLKYCPNCGARMENAEYD